MNIAFKHKNGLLLLFEILILYMYILQKKAKVFTRELKLNTKQQDNDPKHTKIDYSRNCFGPSQNRGILWKDLKQAVNARKETVISEFKLFFREHGPTSPNQCAACVH